MLSVAIVAKNEEKTIGECIKSVLEIANEVVLVDSGSEDRTVEIARELGAKVFFREWTDYVQQVNYAISLCKGEWILVLDADEVLTDELRASIKKAVKENRNECYQIRRRLYYLGRLLRFSEKKIRLFKKGRGKYEGFVHERVICEDRVRTLEGYMIHYSYESLNHHIAKVMGYARMVASNRKDSVNPFTGMVLKPLWTFIKHYLLKGCWRDGYPGFVYSAVISFYTFMKYAFMYENHIRKIAGKATWKK